MSDYLLFPALPYLEIDQKAIVNITFFLTYSMYPVTTSAGWGYLHLTFIPWESESSVFYELLISGTSKNLLDIRHGLVFPHCVEKPNILL